MNDDFRRFLLKIDNELLCHRVIQNNEYTRWFAQGEMSLEQLRYFTVQFSVFSNLFLVAQLKKMINAVDLEEMHQSKEILANEIGCLYRRTDGKAKAAAEKQNSNMEEEGDPSVVSAQGTVDGGTFKFKAAHFEWLLQFSKPLGLGFSDLGKRSKGSASTLFFCDELDRIYGNEDFNIAAGASFAVENWAAAGFWKELSQGLRGFREKEDIKIPLGFFTWHDKVEEQHKQGTFDELEELYEKHDDFNEATFMEAGKTMLDGVAAFWDGLNEQRQNQCEPALA